MNLYEQKAQIHAKVSKAELLAGLAEEAAELAQAALKYRRAIDGANPTPMAAAKAMVNLYEEVADVTLYLGVLELIADVAFYSDTPATFTEEKLRRWQDRLKGVESMNSPVLKIRRLDSGKYLATVGKKARMFDTLPEAAKWAEEKLGEPTQAAPEDVAEFWQDQ